MVPAPCVSRSRNGMDLKLVHQPDLRGMYQILFRFPIPLNAIVRKRPRRTTVTRQIPQSVNDQLSFKYQPNPPNACPKNRHFALKLILPECNSSGAYSWYL